MFLDLLMSLVLGWNLITVSEPVHPQEFAAAHQCVEAIWWYDGEWHLWDTSMPFVDGDFFLALEGWEPQYAQGAWSDLLMTPEYGYWVYCA